MSAYVAVDLGASSGRVIVGAVDGNRVELTEVHRFANEPVELPDGLHWDVLGLYKEVLAGLRAAEPHRPRSAGIDSWAVDYGLLDAGGALLGLPYHYRDRRTGDRVDPLDPAEMYRRTGLAQQPFNTLYQLRADDPARLAAAGGMLMLPDLFAYWLTGERGAERTNASTTQLYNAIARDWDDKLIAAAGLPRHLFARLRDPGTVIGPLRAATGLDGTLVAVGSHDTASAVAAVPATGDRFAYISCGTWSLVGVELPSPVLTEASRAAGFTNEAGLDGTIRYLRNVMGLWLLQECQRAWRAVGLSAETADLVAAAYTAPPFVSVVNPDDPTFLPAGDMPARIDAYCRRTDQPVPASPAAYARCVFDSLAVAHRAAVRGAAELSGRDVDQVHIVGGGSRNDLLCQLTADACGLPVVAGPVEATALGNVLVQAGADGGPRDLASLRAVVRASQPTRRFEPDRAAAKAWDAAAARIGVR
ncbi:rhamnulokinase family protein [Luedemannella flava]|uniref:Rhamnulokinase family protein n=1 Tax=Luedemannella flava TaxID=349316 RepID=A0ABN2LBU9_9ACTN